LLARYNSEAALSEASGKFQTAGMGKYRTLSLNDQTPKGLVHIKNEKKKARGVGLANRPSVHSVVLFAVYFTYFLANVKHLK
jgi:hypothetical protein